MQTPRLRGRKMVRLMADLAMTVDTHVKWCASYWGNDGNGRVVATKLLKRKPKDK